MRRKNKNKSIVKLFTIPILLEITRLFLIITSTSNFLHFDILTQNNYITLFKEYNMKGD